MSESKTKPMTQGVHHVGLTVSNLDEARHFFTKTLRYQQIGEKPDYPAAILSDGTTLITLWQAADPTRAAGFDRNNAIGLHHLALLVDGKDALESLHQNLIIDTHALVLNLHLN